MDAEHSYQRGFLPYALAALLIGLVGGFSAVLSPAFVQDLGLDYNNTTWTALAQAMSTAACAPILGRVGDVIGRRVTLLLGVAVFTLGNVLTVLAGSLAVMLAARFVTGVGIAAMTPVIMAYIVTRFPPDRVARGFSLYMLISSGSVILGPTAGSLIIRSYGWRAMMALCVLFCGVIFVLCLLTAREKDVPAAGGLRGFDGPGAALVLLFFSLLVCVPSVGQNLGWRSRPFLWVLSAALVSLGGLLLAERRAVSPILPGGFMKRRVFVLSVLALFLTQGLMQANMTNLIVFVNHTRPENTAVSGYAISVMYLGMALGAVLLGPLADRREPRTVLTGSLLLTGLGCGCLLLFSAVTPTWLLMASLGLLGLGLGGNGTIFMKVALSGLPAAQAGAGTGTYGLFRDLAAPFGVAVFVPLFTNRITAGTAGGLSASAAAVSAVHLLALVELLCVAGGLAAVLCLPKIYDRREQA